jgi:tetratricopeptide (TPR) repeat protein
VQCVTEKLISMSSQRPTILMGILLLLGGGYFAKLHLERTAAFTNNVPAPLPGQNTVTGLRVHQSEDGSWIADFDYYFTGAPAFATVFIETSLTPNSGRGMTFVGPAQRGRQHVSIPLQHPGSQVATTSMVIVKLQSGTVLASQSMPQVIEWPPWDEWQRERAMARQTPAELVADAVALIDSDFDQNVTRARSILERAIARDPKQDAAYIELARVAMKSNWGPEGLHQAESFLASARQINPDNPNAKILLGYVLANQGHYQKAQVLFEEAASVEPKNLWLWTNWGQMLVMQGKQELAVQKYREGLARPRTHDTYDRARLMAYQHLLALLEKRDDVDGIGQLLEQRMTEFGTGGCYATDFARFLLQRRGETERAIKLAQIATNSKCSGEEARRVLGLGYYVSWASAPPASRAELLNQARIFLPSGPMPLYLLASSERTVAAAKKLIEAGEAVDQKDNDHYNALAYAFQRHEITTARRLLKLGARPDTPVGDEGIPLALAVLVEGDAEAVRLLQHFGADYSKLSYQGMSARQIAKATGNAELLEHESKAPVL